MSYDTTVPVWSIIAFTVPMAGMCVWTIIKMIFWQKEADRRFEKHDGSFKELEKETEDAIKQIKQEFENQLSDVKETLKKTLEKATETQILVKLLVDNKIKQ